MNRQYPSDAPRAIHLEPVVLTSDSARGAHKEPTTLLGWLDRYFLATPYDRMQDDYIAFWP